MRAGRAAGAGALGIGRVEGVEEGVAHVALAEQVERAPEMLGRVSVFGPEVDGLGLGEDQVLDFLFDRGEHAGAIHLGIQLARNRQHRVADAFGIEPAAVHAAEERVFRIVGGELRVGLLDWRYVAEVTNSRCSGLSRQPSRISSEASQSSSSGCDGGSPRTPKSLGRGDDSAAEVMLPEPIHDHPARQRIARVE